MAGWRRAASSRPPRAARLAQGEMLGIRSRWPRPSGRMVGEFVRDLQVDLPARAAQQRAVGDLVQQAVAEAVEVGRRDASHHVAGALEFAQERRQLRGRPRHQPRQQGGLELRTDHRGVLGHRLGGTQAIELGHQRIVDRAGLRGACLRGAGLRCRAPSSRRLAVRSSTARRKPWRPPSPAARHRAGCRRHGRRRLRAGRHRPRRFRWRRAARASSWPCAALSSRISRTAT